VPKSYHLHLVSDATGETTHNIARACLAQFEGVSVVEHMWPKVLTMPRLERVIAAVESNPGAVVYTMLDETLSAALRRECTRLRVPCISVLDGIMQGLSSYFGARIRGQPGRQHVMDQEYFDRIDAMQFVLNHDDGQSAWNIRDADIVLIGVSRTSKTPTSIYLATSAASRRRTCRSCPASPCPRKCSHPTGRHRRG